MFFLICVSDPYAAAAHAFGQPLHMLRCNFRQRKPELSAVKAYHFHCRFYRDGVRFDEKIGKQPRIFEIQLLRLKKISVKAKLAQFCNSGRNNV